MNLRNRVLIDSNINTELNPLKYFDMDSRTAGHVQIHQVQFLSLSKFIAAEIMLVCAYSCWCCLQGSPGVWCVTTTVLHTVVFLTQIHPEY